MRLVAAERRRRARCRPAFGAGKTPVEAFWGSATLRGCFEVPSLCSGCCFSQTGLVSAVDEWLHWHRAFPFDRGPRHCRVRGAGDEQCSMVAIIGITPRAPRRLLVPLVLFVWWAGSGHGFSLGVSGRCPIWPLGLAIAAGAAGFRGLVFVSRPEWARWTLPFAVNDAPAFSWKYLLARRAGDGLAFGVFAASCVALGIFRPGRIAYRGLCPRAPGWYLLGRAHVPIGRSRSATRRA